MKEEYYKCGNTLYHLHYFSDRLPPYITGYHPDMNSWSNCINDMPINIEVDFLKMYGIKLTIEELEKEVNKLRIMFSLTQ